MSMTREQLQEVFRPIAAREPGHRRGDFLTVFAEAVMRADWQNFELLRPAALALIRKYGLGPPEASTDPWLELREIPRAIWLRRKIARCCDDVEFLRRVLKYHATPPEVARAALARFKELTVGKTLPADEWPAEEGEVTGASSNAGGGSGKPPPANP